MKKIAILLLAALMLLGLASCSEKTTLLHCDGCGVEVEFKHDKSANPDESWSIFCGKCAEDLPE